MQYALFNLVLVVTLGLGGILYVRSKQLVLDALRASLFVTLLALPWDAWAIQQGTWAYNDPGPFVLAVPVNDLLFIAVCSFFSACVVGKALVPLELNVDEKREMADDA